MKVVHTPSPSRNKQPKANLFVNDNPEELEVIRTTSANADANKVMLRIDPRTHVLVHPKNATPEYAAKLRAKYGYQTSGKKRNRR